MSRLFVAVLLICTVLPTSGFAKDSGPPRKCPVSKVVLHTVESVQCPKSTQIYPPLKKTKTDWWVKQIEGGTEGIHYIVGTDGYVHGSIPETQFAPHVKHKNPVTGCSYNDESVGIEIVNNGGTDPFGNSQLNATCKLVGSLMRRYGLDFDDVYGHGDLETEELTCGDGMTKCPRRNDPGPMFPWAKCSEIAEKAAKSETPVPLCVASNVRLGKYSGTWTSSIGGVFDDAGRSSGSAAVYVRSSSVAITTSWVGRKLVGYIVPRVGNTFTAKQSYQDGGASISGSASGTIGVNVVTGNYKYKSVDDDEVENGSGTFRLECQSGPAP